MMRKILLEKISETKILYVLFVILMIWTIVQCILFAIKSFIIKMDWLWILSPMWLFGGLTMIIFIFSMVYMFISNRIEKD